MRVSIPVMDDREFDSSISQHFGRAPYFALVDTEKNEISLINNRSEHFGGSGKPPEILASHKVEVMLCSNLGPRAIHLFEEYGIEVFVGASGSVREVMEQWKAGKLREATDAVACKEHRH